MLWLALLLVAATASAQQMALPLKVRANGRYFVDQNGTPVFWLGTTQWELFHGYNQEDARTILEESRKNGFTFVQVGFLGVGDDTRPNVYGQKPWLNNDPLMPNDAYFRNVDAVLQMARDNNLIVSVSVFHQLHRKRVTLDRLLGKRQSSVTAREYASSRLRRARA